MHKLPLEISAYIFKHYYGGYLSDVKSVKDKYGHVYYKINLHENGVVHYLKFREEGDLIKHETEPLLEEFNFY